MVKRLLLLAVFVLSMEGIASAQCGGRRMPIRSLIAAKPLATTIQKIQSRSHSSRDARAVGCSGETATGCSGVIGQAAKPAPTATPLCENGRCDVVRNIIAAPARLASNAYQQALASAQYRAANRIKGHTHLDTHRVSGVGWASHDASPATCLGRGGEAYAVAQGVDGFYSTKFR